MNDDDGFTPAAGAFDAAAALVLLKRQLRELKLNERGSRYESKGRAVVELSLAEGLIRARLVTRPASTPQWTSHELGSSAKVRDFVRTLRQQLARWSQDE